VNGKADETRRRDGFPERSEKKDLECRRAASLVPWIAAGSAPIVDKVRLYRHVADCPPCRTDLAQALALSLRVRQAVGGLPPATAGLWEKIATRLQPDRVLPESRPSTVLLGKALGALESASLPRLASAPLRWVLSWI